MLSQMWKDIFLHIFLKYQEISSSATNFVVLFDTGTICEKVGEILRTHIHNARRSYAWKVATIFSMHKVSGPHQHVHVAIAVIIDQRIAGRRQLARQLSRA